MRKCCFQMIINKLSYALFRIDWVLNPNAGNMLLSINAYDIREIELAFRDLVLQCSETWWCWLFFVHVCMCVRACMYYIWEMGLPFRNCLFFVYSRLRFYYSPSWDLTYVMRYLAIPIFRYLSSVTLADATHPSMHLNYMQYNIFAFVIAPSLFLMISREFAALFN